MNQNFMEETIELEKSQTSFFAVADDAENLYVSERSSNGLFCIDKKSQKAKLLDVFESNYINDFHNCAVCVGKEVWFIPRNHREKISIYNKEDGQMQCINLPPADKKCDGINFLGAVYVDNHVWLIPSSYNAFLKINANTKEIVKSVKFDINDYSGMNFSINADFYFDKDRIYMCPWNCDFVSYLDLKSEQIHVVKNNIPTKKYGMIFVKDEKIYLLERGYIKNILIIDCVSGEESKTEIQLNGFHTITSYYDKDKEECWLFPNLTDNRIIILNVNNMEYRETEIKCECPAEVGLWYKAVRLSDCVLVTPDKIANNYYLMIKDGRIQNCKFVANKNYVLDQLILMMDKREVKNNENSAKN